MVNLLSNPGFEGAYYAWNRIAEISVAEGWLPFWVSPQAGDEGWKNRTPIYQAATYAVSPHRTRSGQTAQMYATDMATHVAGLMQTVQVSAGQRLRFRAYGHAWSTDQDTVNSSIDPGNVRMKIGIDPTGGTNPFSSQVVWSAGKAVYDDYDDGFEVEAVAACPTVTVFLISSVEKPRKHNAIFWDDASLEVVQNVTLVLNSPSGQTGQSVSAQVVASSPLTNVYLNVSSPAGIVEPRWVGMVNEGGSYIWNWAFVPNVEGPYTATFGADGIEAVTETIRIRGFAPPSVSEGSTTAPQLSVRGAPRVQYQRTYVLLPPNAGREWVQALLDSEAWLKNRWTVGFSADDAGIGDLDNRLVIVINPSAWPDPIVAWFELWYPGVRVHPIAVKTPAELKTALRMLAE
jgi:hypothetical protein